MTQPKNILVHLQQPASQASQKEAVARTVAPAADPVRPGKVIHAEEITEIVRLSLGKRASKVMATDAVRMVVGTITADIAKKPTLRLGKFGTFKSVDLEPDATIAQFGDEISFVGAPKKAIGFTNGSYLKNKSVIMDSDLDALMPRFFKEKEPAAKEARAVKAALGEIVLHLSKGNSFEFDPAFVLPDERFEPGSSGASVLMANNYQLVGVLSGGVGKIEVFDPVDVRGEVKAKDSKVMTAVTKPPTIRIGVWDLGAYLGKLPDLLERMGGLLSRHFLESGKYASHPAWHAVRLLAMMGTPHRGAAVALPLCLGLERKLFLNADQVLQLASNTAYPSAYQLLPRPTEPIAWDGSGGDLPVMDIYEAANADRLRLNAENLETARRFHESLDGGVRPGHVRYFCFSGNREMTMAYVRLQTRAGNRLRPAGVEQSDAGDGPVPNWSSTLPGTQFLYIAGEHGTIYKTRDLLRTLASLLGRPGVLAVGVVIEILLREQVVAPLAQVHATLKLGVNTTIARGNVVVERLELDTGGKLVRAHSFASHPIRYEGPEIEIFAIVFEAPEIRGHYRVSYLPEKSTAASSEAELIVQEPGV